MVDYLVVALQHPSGGWVACLPDFVGITGRATSMQHAIDRATAGAREFCAIVVSIKKAMPAPCELGEAQRNHRWAKEYGIDWERAVIQTVALAYPGTPQRRQARKQGGGMVAPRSRTAHGPASATGRGGVGAAAKHARTVYLQRRPPVAVARLP
jgi:predicted RNase H-like HicB family nuclease